MYTIVTILALSFPTFFCLKYWIENLPMNDVCIYLPNLIFLAVPSTLVLIRLMSAEGNILFVFFAGLFVIKSFFFSQEN